MLVNASRGTKDILPEEIPIWQAIETKSRHLFSLYGFEEIRTPIFESTDLFERGIGDQSDIVQKEMYTFLDKGERMITLRPEGTAPVVRAFLQHQMYSKSPSTKLYYIGPMFRYERPQAGRYRQFHQIGVEHIGSAHPSVDAEVIAMAYHLFQELGLKNLKVHINTIGDEICRPVIEERIKQFLAANVKNFPEDIQRKFEHAPLRILDTKDEKVQMYLSGMPDMHNALSQKSKDHFNTVLSCLDTIGIPFEVKPTLVRGLDYYTETVFEIVSDDLGGAQNTLCGGGRYNNLISELGGPQTPAVGFAFGIERAVLLLKKSQQLLQKQPLRFYIAPIGAAQQSRCFQIANDLRRSGVSCEIDLSKETLKAHLKNADRLEATHTIIFGEAEAEKKAVILKNMVTGEQIEISIKKLPRYLMKLCLL